MSATGRGKQRVDFDYYPTPPWCVWRLLDRNAEELGLLEAPRLLEPTVGDGAIVRAVDGWIRRETGRAADLPEWTGVELRRGAVLEETELDHLFDGVDFRAWDPDRYSEDELPGDGYTVLGDAAAGDLLAYFDGAIGNPPYNLAEAMIRHALEMSRWVAMLLRVGFLGSGDRVPFWSGVGRDPWLRVLPDRPSFDGEGTDSATYGWFIWGDVDLRGDRIEVLDETPIEVRRAQLPATPTGLPQLGLDL